MQSISSQLVRATAVIGLATAMFSVALQAQGDAAKTYKTNCALCHAADGSGHSPSGKALGAKDLASDETQKKSDAELAELISKGKGKMPAFGKKLKPDDIAQLVAYVRTLAKKK